MADQNENEVGRGSAPGQGTAKTHKRRDQRKRARDRARASPHETSSGPQDGPASPSGLTWEAVRNSLVFEFGEEEVRKWEAGREAGPNSTKEPAEEEEDSKAFIGRSKFSLLMTNWKGL